MSCTLSAASVRPLTDHIPRVSAPLTCRCGPGVPEASLRPAQAHRDRDVVISKTVHEPMSHFHYHYKPVPADDVDPPRNRNIVLPRYGGILDTTV